jgi:hypothetical protein
MEFGFYRLVEERFIDLDQTAKMGLIDRDIEGSPNGCYPVAVVPKKLIGKKVLIIPVDESNIPLSIEDMVNDKSPDHD